VIERLIAFGIRCHRYCLWLCIGEALVFAGILVGMTVTR
jgi:hypothetical protein